MDLVKPQSVRELFPPEPAFSQPAWKVLAFALRRRWWMALICFAAALLVGVSYLLFAPKTFETSGIVRVDASDSPQPGTEAPATDFLARQPDVMRSTPVIALALSSPEVRGSSLLRGKKSRIEFIRSNLVIHSAGETGVFELALATRKPAEAEKIIDALVAAYIQFSASSRSADAPQTATLRDQKQKIDNELAAATKQLNDTLRQQAALSPAPQSREQLARERAELIAELGRPTQSLDAQKAMQGRFDQLNKLSQQNDALDEQITHMQGEVERLTFLRDDSSQRLAALGHSRTNAASIAVVKSSATDSDPVWPRPFAVLGLCALAGVVFGAMAALVVDQTRDRIHDSADATALTGVPLLGSVPAMSADLSSARLRGQCVLVKPTERAARGFRDVCTALEGLIAAGLDKTILVTGPGNAQGKSVLASNLAIAMARRGNRVALVDANHHRPMVNKIFAIEDYIGLNNAIDGMLNLNDVLHVTGLYGLDVLPTGSSTADWSELFNRPEFMRVLTELSDRFDRVIIDGGAAHLGETRIISAFCDVTVLTVDGQRCRRRDLRSAAKGLRAVGAKLAGIVMNDLPVHRINAATSLNRSARRRPRRAHLGTASRFVETA